jgi:acylphosphatase
MIELHAIIKGRVQGVGFRWTVVDHAERFHLTGVTKNLANGTVEIYAQGSQETLEAFLDSIQKDSGLARIESVTSEYRKSDKVYQGFRIIH